MSVTATKATQVRAWVSRRRGDLLAVGLCAAAYLALLAAISPRHEFPLNDDWLHALAVRRLLATGQVRLPAVTALSLVFDIYWGALFAWLAGGLSFTALRVSTLVLSLAGVLGMYALVRQLGGGRPAAVLSAAVLLFNPLYLYLSYTFMTDVPFLALALLALNAYVYGIRRDADGWLLAGSVLAALAFLSRQPGLALPGAAILGLLAARRPRLRSLLAAVAVPVAAALIYYYWLNNIHGVPWVQSVVKLGGTRAFWARPGAVSLTASRVLVSFVYLGMWASPILVGRLVTLAGRRPLRLGWPALAAALGTAGSTAVIVFATSQYAVDFPYLINVINWNGIGTQPLLGTKPPIWPAWTNTPAGWVGIPAGGALAWLAARAAWDNARGQRDAACIVVLAACGAAGAGYFLLQEFFDRYLLVFVPAACLLAWRGPALNRAGLAVAWLGCAALAAYSLTGVADHLAWNEARWTAGRMLVAEGIAPEAIGGEYEWTGWYEYEQVPPPAIPADELPPGTDKHYWEHVNPKLYWLSFNPLDGYEVYLAVPYGRAGSRIYVLTEAAPP